MTSKVSSTQTFHDCQKTVSLRGTYVEVLKEFICLVKLVAQLHMHKLWLPQERQGSFY